MRLQSRRRTGRQPPSLGCAAWLLTSCRSGVGLTKGDLYTLWAPRWRDAGDEWEALLGKDEDLYGFESVADLVAFVRTNSDNDLTDHPAWEGLTQANAHSFDPPEERQYDLIGVQELLAEKPTEDSVATLHRTLAIVSSIGSVCELSTVTKFFNGNPVLGSLGAGIDTFSGRSGRKRWSEIGAVIGRNWDNVVDAIDEVVTIPDVDAAASEKAAAELKEPKPEPEELEELDETEADDADVEDSDEPKTPRTPMALLPTTRAAWCSAPTRTSGSRSASTRSG